MTPVGGGECSVDADSGTMATVLLFLVTPQYEGMPPLHETSHHVVFRKLPHSRERKPLFIVGDVHGCADELDDIIVKAKQHVKDFQLVLVGDLFTKGPDPLGVFALIKEHNALCVKGNHDWAIWSWLQVAEKRGLDSLPQHTKQTIKLLRHARRAVFDFVAALPHGVTTHLTFQGAPDDWAADVPLVIVHAGYDCVAGLGHTSERMLLTVRYVRVPEDPLDRRLILVPSTSRTESLGHKDKLRWHQFHNGPELVVFGHDAKQGLFRKTAPNRQPICVGIDTGCTYGRSLTGYFPERDEAIQVPARRTYFDTQANLIVLKRHL